MAKVEYQNSVISYLDVLGFRDLIKTRTPGQISRIVRVLQETTRPGEDEKKVLAIRHLNFSDTTVRITPLTGGEEFQEALFAEILNLAHVQMDLIRHGILVRGALSVGDVVRSWRVTYGPGLVKAYELEQVRQRRGLF